jgi:hypothetical protein
MRNGLIDPSLQEMNMLRSTKNRDIQLGVAMMLRKIKSVFEKNTSRWFLSFFYYLIILLALLFLYGFHEANSGSYIYNEF